MALKAVDYSLKLLGITESLRRWQGVISEADERRRERVAKYAEQIAGTLGRVIEAYEKLEKTPGDAVAVRSAVREFGRISGYLENIVNALEGHVDGRRLAGIKRRLESLAAEALVLDSIKQADAARIERLASAEGYFRALADGLRA
jgi:hypothetical protein